MTPDFITGFSPDSWSTYGFNTTITDFGPGIIGYFVFSLKLGCRSE